MVLLSPPKSTLRKRGIIIDKWIAAFNKRGIFASFQNLHRTKDDSIPYGQFIMVRENAEQELPTLDDK